MNKQKKQLFLLLGVLVLFIAAYFGLQAYNNAAAEKEKEVEGEEVISMDYSDVEILEFTADEGLLQFECIDGTWYVTGDHSQNVKQYRIKSILNGIACPLLSEGTIKNVTDLSLYGLDEPAQEILVGNDAEKYTIYVGDNNSMLYTYYVYLSTDPTTVYAVGSENINRLDYGLSDFVEATEESAEDVSSEEGTIGESVTDENNAETSQQASTNE